jgi:CTP synthase (UTP-ammonia lyase)
MALARARHPALTWEWVPTASIGGDPARRLRDASGIWLVPASPYADEAGALAAITHARVSGLPFLGTCGGFQHALIEFAREVLGRKDAGHAETGADAPLLLVTPLACPLVEQTGDIHILSGTRLRDIYGRADAREGYHCSYGLAPAHESLLVGLTISARDDRGEVRAVELPGHRFFHATLFQPERRALSGELHPLVAAFIEAAA